MYKIRVCSSQTHEGLFCFTHSSARLWWINLPLWCISDLPSRSLWYQAPWVYPNLRQSPWMWPSRWVPSPCLHTLQPAHSMSFGMLCDGLHCSEVILDGTPCSQSCSGAASVIGAAAGNRRNGVPSIASVDVKHTWEARRSPRWCSLLGMFFLSLWPLLLVHISKLSIFLQNLK